MNAEDRPFVPVGNHPIETGRYLIATNQISNFAGEIESWIHNRTPGGIVYGRPRVGKTRAIKYLLLYLPSIFGESIPIFSVLCKYHKIPNESSFYEEILSDLNYAYPNGNKANIKRDRLVKFLLEKAELSGQFRIIMFFDEAQRLYEMNYNWLMDIYNELDNYGVALTVILVGQEELIHSRSGFIQSKKNQIIGRFMVREYKFTGVKSIDDISACLNAYDNMSEYPQGSGWSFTRFFFPTAFMSGLRLEECAQDLYEIFKIEREKEKIPGSFEIPMQYITLSIEFVLKKFGVNGENLDWINKAQWKIAVNNSGYIEAEKYNRLKKVSNKDK